MKNVKNGPKWSICKQNLKEKHQKKFQFENQQINQNHSQIIEHQSKSQQKLKNLKNGPKWSICKQSCKRKASKEISFWKLKNRWK